MRDRLKEPWMRTGARVDLPNGPGTLKTFTEANLDGKQVVLSVSVQPDGVKHSFPFNPYDIEPRKPTVCPFPDHLG